MIMACPAISSYSFWTTSNIFYRMFPHMMKVCRGKGFWFSWNITDIGDSYTCHFIQKYIDHGLSGYLLIQFFELHLNYFLQDVSTYNDGVQGHRIMIFMKYFGNWWKLDLVIFIINRAICLVWLSLHLKYFLQDVSKHNDGVQGHRILIFMKYYGTGW